MSKYADDAGRLVEPADAEFLARKLGADDVFDFAGVTDASAEFLHALFAGQDTATLDGRLTGAAGALDAALAAWRARAPGPVTPTGGLPTPAAAKDRSKP